MMDMVRKNRRLVLGGLVSLMLARPLAAHGSAPMASPRWTVSPVDQGHSNLCWLACVTMMISWRASISYSMSWVAKLLGAPFEAYYQDGIQGRANQGLLLGDEVELLAKRAELTRYGLASFDTSWWLNQLQYGPLVILGMNPDAQIGHAKLLVQLEPSGSSPTDLIATVVDPATARIERQPFLALIQFYERLARQPLKYALLQILSSYNANATPDGADQLLSILKGEAS